MPGSIERLEATKKRILEDIELMERGFPPKYLELKDGWTLDRGLKQARADLVLIETELAELQGEETQGQQA
jgi:hypothetical protein